MDVVKLKHRMARFVSEHGLQLPAVPEGFNPDKPTWGPGAQVVAWRITGHLRDQHGKQAVLAHTTRAAELWEYFYPPSVRAEFRSAVVKGYDSLHGIREGSAAHLAICKFTGLSVRDPWCAGGHWWVVKHLAKFNGPTPANVNYVPTMENYAQAHDILRGKDQTWLPGMSVTFCWDGIRRIGKGDHIGTIDAVKAAGVVLRTVHTDEANASDTVRECSRSWQQVNCVFDLARLQK